MHNRNLSYDSLNSLKQILIAYFTIEFKTINYCILLILNSYYEFIFMKSDS